MAVEDGGRLDDDSFQTHRAGQFYVHDSDASEADAGVGGVGSVAGNFSEQDQGSRFADDAFEFVLDGSTQAGVAGENDRAAAEVD